MAVLKKVAQRNYCRTYDVVITVEHSKGLCLIVSPSMVWWYYFRNRRVAVPD